MTLHKASLKRTHWDMVKFKEHDEDWANVSQCIRDAADRAIKRESLLGAKSSGISPVNLMMPL